MVRGKIVLQQPVHLETWKPEQGGGALELMTLCHKDGGVHGFCVAIEGGAWLVQECEVTVASISPSYLSRTRARAHLVHPHATATKSHICTHHPGHNNGYC